MNKKTVLIALGIGVPAVLGSFYGGFKLGVKEGVDIVQDAAKHRTLVSELELSANARLYQIITDMDETTFVINILDGIKNNRLNEIEPNLNKTLMARQPQIREDYARLQTIKKVLKSKNISDTLYDIDNNLMKQKAILDGMYPETSEAGLKR